MLLIIVVLVLQQKGTESSDIPLPDCPTRCGNVLIPYPFGIGDNCSMSEDYNVTCSNNSIPCLFCGNPYKGFEILNISIPLGQARLNTLISSQCYNTTTKLDDISTLEVLSFVYNQRPFWLNNEKNKFIVTGCNTLAYLSNQFSDYNYSIGCLSTCDNMDSLNKYGPNCSGIGCCQTEIPFTSKSFYVQFDVGYNHSRVYNFSPCSYAMVVEINNGFQSISNYSTSYDMVDKSMPVVFDWAVGNMTCEDAQKNKSSYACRSDNSACSNYTNGDGYICRCSEGYAGNPYLYGGCQDIDECATQNPCPQQAKCHNIQGNYSCSWPRCHFGKRRNSDNICELNLTIVIGGCAGIVALSFLGFAIYIVMERRKFSKEKEKYFEQHGGLILLEKTKSLQGFGFTIFTMKQVEEATNNFDSAKIIGHGGQGTVYKATLNDRSAAIKKCKIIDESKKKEFGKEMLILSQINHKNIVKLIGCCLEAEVPMLIYEFIPNGTLFHHIHNEKQGSTSNISFFNRLRIAHESAEALAYLHTSASPPIIHGDVKSANILLDQNYMAKVSDFGASVLAPIDEVQFVTLVQGTCGYLDPEYMQSCQLTEKSDVYSFGVVLLELLTSKPVIDFNAPEDERSLSSRFLSAMEEKKIHELLDDQIVSEDDLELIMEVSQLAKECLSIRGDERPTMKEVADELVRIKMIKQHPWRQEYHPEETETLLGESSHHMEIEYTGSFSQEKNAEKIVAAR